MVAFFPSESASCCSCGSIASSFKIILRMSLFSCENALSFVCYCVIDGSGLAVVIDAHVSRKVGRE